MKNDGLEPGRPQIEPGGRQNAKNNDQDGQKKPGQRKRCSQERKKGAQERKMCQHGPNIARHAGGLDSDFGRTGLPLSMQSSMLMQAKNAVGSNTAGAASSVPDFVSALEI